MGPHSSESSNPADLFSAAAKPATSAHTAHIDGGARGNPGPAGYGVVIQDAAGRTVAELSEYLGHQTNNYAEYQGLIGVLRYATGNGIKSLKVVSDSELMVRQMNGIYKVKNPDLRKLHDEAQQMVRKLDHFEIRHAMREHNVDADRLANEAMDRGKSGRTTSAPAPAATIAVRDEFDGIVRNGVVELTGGSLPDGTRVQVRVRR
ncbi:MAG: ribonuclease HI family protein [Acidobacteria bacterium]|nr:ribonuclease HI family protein [Acidobacteriota bacterium]